MPLAEDQHPVGDLGPGREHEPFRIGIQGVVAMIVFRWVVQCCAVAGGFVSPGSSALRLARRALLLGRLRSG